MKGQESEKQGSSKQEYAEKTEGEERREGQESFSFLQETVKPKEIRREQVAVNFIRIMIYGLLAGMAACCGFYALRPWAEQTFQGEAQEVTFPEEEPEEEKTDAEETEQEKKEELVLPALTADDYREIMQSMYGIAREAEKSVVSVQRADENWLEGTEQHKAAAGLLAADNGKELLVLTEDSICKEGERWAVTFADGSRYDASLRKRDGNRGLAVFGVERASVETGTWNAVQVAELGNSSISVKGDLVIALGGMFGYENGMSYGIISSKEHYMTYADGQCGMIATDIPASAEGSGVLFNQKGQAIGLLKGGVWGEREVSAASALAISDLKPVMELMLNGESVPYTGIYGVTVTEELAEQQEIPKGLYVTNVQADSPAMQAGIQNGDVLLEVGDDKVAGVTSYEKALLEYKVGTTVKIKGKRRGAGGYVDVDFHVTPGSKE